PCCTAFAPPQCAAPSAPAAASTSSSSESPMAAFRAAWQGNLRSTLGKNLLCIAGGSGIAGMMAILSRAATSGYFERHRAWVFFGVRTMRDAFFLDELSAYT